MVDPDVLPAWLTPLISDYYVGEFTRSGLFGPISRYRYARPRLRVPGNCSADRKIEQPRTFFVSGTRDPAFNMLGRGDPIAIMRKHVTDLRVADVPRRGCGLLDSAGGVPSRSTRG